MSASKSTASAALAARWPVRQPVLVMLNDDTLERLCRAHWPTWDRMRPDHQRKWREKMRGALLAMFFDEEA